jgi:Protein of unknown function (DUF742)
MAPEPPDNEASKSWTSQYRRPYAVTKGRTRPASEDLAVEALVSTTDRGLRTPPANRMERSIAMMCQEVHSIIEIATRLELPLGATRVLVSDMAERGLVVVHGTVTSGEVRPDSALLQRVLQTLRAL